MTVGAVAIKEQMSGVAHLIEDGVCKAGVRFGVRFPRGTSTKMSALSNRYG